MPETFDERPSTGRIADNAPAAEPEIQLPGSDVISSRNKEMIILELLKKNSISYSHAEATATQLLENLPRVQTPPPPVPEPAVAPVFTPEPVAPAPAAPLPEVKPEVVAPVAAPVASAAVPPVPPQPAPPAEQPPAEVATPSVAHTESEAPAGSELPVINFGDKEPRNEFNSLDPKSLDAYTLQVGRLISIMQSLGEVGSDLKRFFSSIPTSDVDNRAMYRSPEEEARSIMLTSAAANHTGFARNGYQTMMKAAESKDTAWEQYVTLPDGTKAGAVVPRDADDSAALRAYRKRTRRGIPNAVWLPVTGILISCRAPDESDLCDFDIRLTLETAELGMNTYGMMLSSTSGVFLRHMVDFALSFVEETTLDCAGNDLKSTLIDKIDSADYWLVILAPIQAMYPDGIPWSICCGHLGCNVVEELRLNIARSIRYGSGLLSDRQKSLWARQRGNPNRLVTQEELDEYSKEHRDVPESVFVYNDIRFEFQRVSMGTYFDATDKWIEDINESVTSALSGMGSQQDREKHLRLTAETRRLTQYAHMVKSITVMGVNDEPAVVESDPIKVLKMLRAMSSDRPLVAAFEVAVNDYSEATRLAIFGYMSRRCKCGHDDGIKDGMYRGIVTISPDKVFFELSRAVSETQKAITKQSEDFG